VDFLSSFKTSDNFDQPSVGTLLPKRKSEETDRSRTQDGTGRTVNTRNHHLVASDITEKDKNKSKIIGPPGPLPDRRDR